jgi:cysteine desulfurase/selenocysteine lyase
MRDRNDILHNVESIRGDFPILKELIHGKPLVYLDSAATTQKPLKVIERISSFYLHENSNIHRSVHHLGEQATLAYEGGRDRVREFINAEKSREIIFTRGATEAINLVAATYGAAHLGAGDEIVVTEMEHHSNIVPWQLLCRQRGATLRVIPINDRGELILEELEPLLSERTKLVALCHVSNSLGTINPVKEVIQRAHGRGIPVLVDGAQATPHFKVDVRDLDADFYVFSSHKMFGPTGVGVLYGKESLLEEMPPYQSGGDMISMVTFEETRYNTLPYKFEAGTPNIAGVIGFAAAL